MAGCVIKVEELSKRYLIGHRQEASYQTVRDAVSTGVRNAGRRLAHPFRSSAGQPMTGMPDTEEFWALRDVSFTVTQGERLGIIGRNGAGKTTLLKVLSRITEPTTGRISLKGRVASLLEVGTGFHPELTGRENIFLNGAILGMGRDEIRSKFDEIVAFAEVERFLDTPVKRYSSGMYVRLAFAVAAHLEPEILLVDEVLAVGDVQFQRKCLGKMEDVTREGRTILFVSHNMVAIQALCQRAVLLDRGEVVRDGLPREVIDLYYRSISSSDDSPVADLSGHPGRKEGLMPVIRKVWIEDSAGEKVREIGMGDPVCIVVQFESEEEISSPGFGVSVETATGAVVFALNNHMVPCDGLDRSARKGRIRFELDSLRLLPDEYYLTVSIGEQKRRYVDRVERAISLKVLERDVFGSGVVPEPPSQGVVFQEASIRYQAGSGEA